MKNRIEKMGELVNDKKIHHSHNDNIPNGHSPYWKRAHHDWRFWVVLVLMFMGVIYYVVTDNFSFVPRNRIQQPHHFSSENNGTR
jgi:hypothetical protein